MLQLIMIETVVVGVLDIIIDSFWRSILEELTCCNLFEMSILMLLIAQRLGSYTPWVTAEETNLEKEKFNVLDLIHYTGIQDTDTQRKNIAIIQPGGPVKIWYVNL